jgi:hypothetical protein
MSRITKQISFQSNRDIWKNLIVEEQAYVEAHYYRKSISLREWTNENLGKFIEQRKKEWTNERTKERKKERKNERKKERKKEQKLWPCKGLWESSLINLSLVSGQKNRSIGSQKYSVFFVFIGLYLLNTFYNFLNCAVVIIALL